MNAAVSPPSGRASAPRSSAGRLVALTVLAVVLGAVIVLTAKVLLVLFAGVLFAVVLRGIAGWIATKTKLPYPLGLTVLVLLGVAGVVAGPVALAPKAGEQVQALARDLPAAMAKLRDRLHHTPVVEKAVGGANVDKLKPELASVAPAAANALGGTLEVLGAFAVVFFVGVYGAAKPKEYTRAVLALTPKKHRRRMQNVLDVVDVNLTRWLLGRLVAMLFVGISCAIAFTILKVPLGLTLAVLAGMLTFIEYIGAIMSAIPPALLAFTRSPVDALWVLVVYSVLHVIEGYVLTPLLARAAVRLPPAITLGSQLVLTTLVGPLGMTFSTPLLVVGVAAVKAWKQADEVLPEAEGERDERERDEHGAPQSTRRVSA